MAETLSTRLWIGPEPSRTTNEPRLAFLLLLEQFTQTGEAIFAFVTCQMIQQPTELMIGEMALFGRVKLKLPGECP